MLARSEYQMRRSYKERRAISYKAALIGKKRTVLSKTEDDVFCGRRYDSIRQAIDRVLGLEAANYGINPLRGESREGHFYTGHINVAGTLSPFLQLLAICFAIVV